MITLQLFYHVAAMGDWQDVVREQLALLSNSGLHCVPVKTTYVGDPSGIPWFLTEAAQYGVEIELVKHDANLLHYETFAMMEIEKWARVNDGAVLYFHTKGVSKPGHDGKRRWRHLMQDNVIAKWEENLDLLLYYEAVGVNWREMRPHSHFCGNFWMARCDYLRTLESFVSYHNKNGLYRTNCEFWISSGPRDPRVCSLVHRDVDYCKRNYFG